MSALDGFRGFGCLLVLLGHTQWTDKKTILPGALTAMDLFFVLSGFLITGILISEERKTGTINLINFWKRRAFRLLPVFYVYFAFGSLVYAFTRFAPIVGTDASVSLWSTAFYFSNWAMAQGYEMGIFAVTWSLSLEEQFYLLCPLIFLLGFRYLEKKTLLYVLGAAILGVNLHRYILFHDMLESSGVVLAFKRCFYGLDTRSDSLLIGCFLAIFNHLYGERFKVGVGLASVVTVTFIGSLFIRDLPVAVHEARNSFYTEFLMSGGLTLFSILGGLAILHVIRFPDSWVTRFFSSNLFVKIGIMSYSIYIWHTTIFGGLEVLLNSMNQSPWLWVLKTLIRFTVAFGVGYASFQFIELPILQTQLKKRKYSPIAEESK